MAFRLLGAKGLMPGLRRGVCVVAGILTTKSLRVQVVEARDSVVGFLLWV